MELEQASEPAQPAHGRPAGAGQALHVSPAAEARAAAPEAVERLSEAEVAPTGSPTPNTLPQASEQQRHTLPAKPQLQGGEGLRGQAASAPQGGGDNTARAAGAAAEPASLARAAACLGVPSGGQPGSASKLKVMDTDELHGEGLEGSKSQPEGEDEEAEGAEAEDQEGEQGSPQRRHPDGQRCSHCGTGESSRWERNPLTKQPLCTRCRQWMRRHGNTLPPVDQEDWQPGAVPVCSNCGDDCSGPKQYRHPATGRRLCGSCRMTLSKRGTLPDVVSGRGWLQQAVQQEQQRQQKADGSSASSSSSEEEEAGGVSREEEEETEGREVKQEASSERSGGQREHAYSSEGQQPHSSGSAPPERQEKWVARAAAAAASGRLRERSTEEEEESDEEEEEEEEENGEDGGGSGSGPQEEGKRLCLHCKGAYHHGRSWHTCPKTGVRWLCEPCFNKVRVALKRAAAGQGGKKRKQPAGDNRTPEREEDEEEEAGEAAEGKKGQQSSKPQAAEGKKGLQGSRRPAPSPSRRKKQKRKTAQQEADPPTPAGPDPAAAAKGRGAAAAAAAHHAAGALTLLASQPTSSGPEPPEPSRPLHPEASWPLQYARLQFLLADSRVEEAMAQDFKWALLGLPEMQQRMHFIELQSLHAGGKVELLKEWVARLLGRD
ncbi:hypothetical protein ABPG75_009641 [Micractinium tetrahymenae]